MSSMVKQLLTSGARSVDTCNMECVSRSERTRLPKSRLGIASRSMLRCLSTEIWINQTSRSKLKPISSQVSLTGNLRAQEVTSRGAMSKPKEVALWCEIRLLMMRALFPRVPRRRLTITGKFQQIFPSPTAVVLIGDSLNAQDQLKTLLSKSV